MRDDVEIETDIPPGEKFQNLKFSSGNSSRGYVNLNLIINITFIHRKLTNTTLSKEEVRQISWTGNDSRTGIVARVVEMHCRLRLGRGEAA